MDNTAISIGGMLAPRITSLLETIKPLLQRANAWVKSNKDVVITVAAVAVGAVAAGAAIIALGAVLSGAGVILGTVVSGVGLLASGLTFLLSPFGLVLAATVGLTLAWANFTESGKETVSEFKAGFTDLASEWKSTFGAIVKALKSGELELAFELVSLQLKKTWTDLMKYMREQWLEFKNSLKDKQGDGQESIGDALIDFAAFQAKTATRLGVNNETEEEIDRRVAAWKLQNRGIYQIEQEMRNEAIKNDPNVINLTAKSKDLEKQIEDLIIRIRNLVPPPPPGGDGYLKLRNAGAEIAEALQGARGTFNPQMAAQALGFDSSVTPEEKLLDDLNKKVDKIGGILQQQLGFD